MRSVIKTFRTTKPKSLNTPGAWAGVIVSAFLTQAQQALSGHFWKPSSARAGQVDGTWPLRMFG
jgi:hypothetical protein